MSGEEDLYDEFGNYVGPDLDSSSSSSEDGEDDVRSVDDDVRSEDAADIVATGDRPPSAVAVTGAPQNAIVLHEDLEYYPDAADVYGPDVALATLEEDATDVDKPLVEPVREKNIHADTFREKRGRDKKKGTPRTKAPKTPEGATARYVEHLSTTPALQRRFAAVGHLQSGKSSLLDLLAPVPARDRRLTDTLKAERRRQMSLKSRPVSALAAPAATGKTHLLAAVDCPGHPNFLDEVVAGLAASDGAVVVVDAADGLMGSGKAAIRAAVRAGLQIVLVVNKVDRLIVELRLPPEDAYCKLLHVVEEAQGLVRSLTAKHPELTPARGNVVFASALHGWTFTAESFAEVYEDVYENLHEQPDPSDPDPSDPEETARHVLRAFAPVQRLSAAKFAQKLWGNWYVDPRSGRFTQSRAECGGDATRTFVRYILEPIYKIYSVCLGANLEDGHQDDVVGVLREKLGVFLSRGACKQMEQAGELIATVMGSFLGKGGVGLVDAIVHHIPSPARNAKLKIQRNYTGPLTSPHAQAMTSCDPSGPLMIHIVKLYPSPDGRAFSCLGRVYSGTVRVGDRVRVLGENYSLEDGEDAAAATVDGLGFPTYAAGEDPEGRQECGEAAAGCWVLMDGLDAAVAKTATVTGPDDAEAEIFAPLRFPEAGHEPVVKLAVEPLNPAELPKMVDGLRGASKSYPMCRTKVEESGEHVVYGTGELYLDCLMYDLRHVFSDIEIKVADPVVAFCETVVEISSLKCFAETPNKRNKLTFVAEPLDDGLAEQIEAGIIKLQTWDVKKTGRFFQQEHRWDLLSARSVWAFGPSPSRGPNVLLDDTLPSEVDGDLLRSCRPSIVQGFRWACREGPLCEEPVRSTKLKVLDAHLASAPILRGGGQIIPAARRAVYSSLLAAAPRLMEPVYRMELQAPGEIVPAILPLLTRRRGHVVQDAPVPGTPLVNVKAYLPVLDSFGFETDLRTFTQGQAMCFATFDHWAVVPGNPLDRSIVLHPLEPSPVQHLAREIMVKTRRRKGLSEDVSVTKFFDEGMRLQMQEMEMD